MFRSFSRTVCFVMAAGVSVAGTSRAEKSANDYWKEAGVDFSVVSKFLDQQCSESAKNLIGCVQAANAALARANPPMKLVTPAEKANYGEQLAKRVKEFGAFTLFETQKDSSKKGFAETWKRTQRLRANQIEAISALFAKTEASHFKIGDVLSSEKDKILAGDLMNNESVIAAQVVNTFLASSVDPHTHLDPIQQIVDENSGITPSYAGIGLTLQLLNEHSFVAFLVEKGPAFNSGLRVNDVMRAVDGKSVENKTPDEIAKLVRGTPGTSVNISVLRKGKTYSFAVKRETITTKNVEAKLVNDSGLPVAYVKLHSFVDRNACQEVKDEVLELQKKGAKALVLDLRDNSGGLVDQGVCIGSLFVGDRTIVQVRSLDSTEMKPVNIEGAVEHIHLPMLTLINSSSASASEIVSGALQDYQRSYVLGQRSFGKATTQSASQIFLSPPKDENEKPKLYAFQTHERFYQPSGRTNQIVGIQPDFTVDAVPNPTEDQKFALREADLFTNALPAVGKPWVNPRAQEVAKISDCVKTSGLPEKLYKAHQEDAIPGDYQLFSAEQVLNCSAGPRLASETDTQ